ncbi:MAG: DUF2752 domain-containing protein [Clostridiaceae bacterium]|jgi:hypothetical protein|nr:DUF2752 domain-containing protein [Clostridiaceae bacterium]
MKAIYKKWLVFFGKPFIRLILFVFTCLAIGMAIYILYRVNPARNAFPLVCSFRHYTGFYCPGCGMTRALYSVIHGNFKEAFSYNLLWPLILLFLIVSVYFWLSFLYSGKNPFNTINRFFQRYSFSGWFVLILFLAFWILRNIPIYPFTLLAPG